MASEQSIVPVLWLMVIWFLWILVGCARGLLSVGESGSVGGGPGPRSVMQPPPSHVAALR